MTTSNIIYLICSEIASFIGRRCRSYSLWNSHHHHHIGGKCPLPGRLWTTLNWVWQVDWWWRRLATLLSWVKPWLTILSSPTPACCAIWGKFLGKFGLNLKFEALAQTNRRKFLLKLKKSRFNGQFESIRNSPLYIWIHHRSTTLVWQLLESAFQHYLFILKNRKINKLNTN